MKYSLIIFAILLIFSSCATAPEVEEDTRAALPETEHTRANELKAQADKYNLVEYAPDEYSQAEQKLKDGEATYKTDNASSKKSLDEAIAGYEAVMTKGFPLLTEKKQEETEAIVKQAEDIKAQVAMKEEYTAARAKYDQALAAQNNGEYEQAVTLFDEAKLLFQDLYEKTKEKKERAEQAMGSSEESIKDFEEQARAGDEELQTGQ